MCITQTMYLKSSTRQLDFLHRRARPHVWGIAKRGSWFLFQELVFSLKISHIFALFTYFSRSTFEPDLERYLETYYFACLKDLVFRVVQTVTSPPYLPPTVTRTVTHPPTCVSPYPSRKKKNQKYKNARSLRFDFAKRLRDSISLKNKSKIQM